MNLEQIAAHYAQLPTGNLTHLISEIDSMRSDVIPLLREELIKRNETEAVKRIDEQLQLQGSVPLKESEEELQKIILARIASGEPLESIRLDLHEQGIDLFNIIEEQAHQELIEDIRISDKIEQLEQQQLSSQKIVEKLQEDNDINPEQADHYRKKIQRKVVWQILGALGLIIILSLRFLNFYTIFSNDTDILINVILGIVILFAFLLIYVASLNYYRHSPKYDHISNKEAIVNLKTNGLFKIIISFVLFFIGFICFVNWSNETSDIVKSDLMVYCAILFPLGLTFLYYGYKHFNSPEKTVQKREKKKAESII